MCGQVSLVSVHMYVYCCHPPLSSSRVLPDKTAAVDAAMSLASDIASKSPVAVYGTKRNLLYSRDHSVEDGLEYAVSEGVVATCHMHQTGSFIHGTSISHNESWEIFIFANGFC